MKDLSRFVHDRNFVSNLKVRRLLPDPFQRTLRLSCPIWHGDHLNMGGETAGRMAWPSVRSERARNR